MKKFSCAIRGILVALTDKGVVMQFLLAIATIILGFFLHLDSTEWLMVIVCIGLVLTSEIVNTSIEKLCDVVNPEYDKRIKDIKDMAAGAVLMAALAAFIVATIIVLRRL